MLSCTDGTAFKFSVLISAQSQLTPIPILYVNLTNIRYI